VLRTLVLRGPPRSGRDVSDANRGFHLVHVLPAFATGAVSVHLQFHGRDDNFTAFLDLGDHIHAGETCVPALVRIKRRDPHEPVHAAFGFAEAIGVLALDQHRCALDAGPLTSERVLDLDLPAARLRPALVHPEEHIRQSQDSVPPAPALMLRMQLLRSCGPLRNTRNSSASRSFRNFATSRFEFLLDVRLRLGRFGLAELEHHPEIVELLLSQEERVNAAAKGIGFVNQFLGLFALFQNVSPDISAFSSPRRFCVAGTSKKPPQMCQFLRGRVQIRFDHLKHRSGEDSDGGGQMEGGNGLDVASTQGRACTFGKHAAVSGGKTAGFRKSANPGDRTSAV